MIYEVEFVLDDVNCSFMVILLQIQINWVNSFDGGSLSKLVRLLKFNEKSNFSLFIVSYLNVTSSLYAKIE